MEIRQTITDAEIAACHPVLWELRGHVPESDLVSKVRYLQKRGCKLVVLDDGKEIVAVAGFRIGENLACGRFLYLDDLVTSGKHGSRGYGSKLLSWLREFAMKNDSRQVHLDSGLLREAADRFCERDRHVERQLSFPGDVAALHGAPADVGLRCL